MAEVHYPVFKAVGEDALLVELEPEISLEVNRRVRQLALAIEQARVPGVGEVIPAYRSLMVYFDPAQCRLAELEAVVVNCELAAERGEATQPRLFRIPTVYGGTHGPDLEHIAATANCTAAEVIERFASQRYSVYCLGFLCSLAYLGGVPPSIQLPRRTTPRTLVAAGSVGIAGGQAVVLPIDMPSGFHYLGRTQVTMYDPARMPPTAIRPGDVVEFPAVTEEESKHWSGCWLGDCLVERT